MRERNEVSRARLPFTKLASARGAKFHFTSNRFRDFYPQVWTLVLVWNPVGTIAAREAPLKPPSPFLSSLQQPLLWTARNNHSWSFRVAQFWSHVCHVAAASSAFKSDQTSTSSSGKSDATSILSPISTDYALSQLVVVVVALIHHLPHFLYSSRFVWSSNKEALFMHCQPPAVQAGSYSGSSTFFLSCLRA